MQKKSSFRDTVLYLILLLVMLGSSVLLFRVSKPVEADFADVYTAFRAGHVDEFAIDGTKLTAKLDDGTYLYHTLASLDVFIEFLGDDVAAQMDAGELTQVNFIPHTESIFRVILPYAAMFVLMILFWGFIQRRAGGGGGAGKDGE